MNVRGEDVDDIGQKRQCHREATGGSCYRTKTKPSYGNDSPCARSSKRNHKNDAVVTTRALVRTEKQITDVSFLQVRGGPRENVSVRKVEEIVDLVLFPVLQVEVVEETCLTPRDFVCERIFVTNLDVLVFRENSYWNAWLDKSLMCHRLRCKRPCAITRWSRTWTCPFFMSMKLLRWSPSFHKQFRVHTTSQEGHRGSCADHTTRALEQSNGIFLRNITALPQDTMTIAFHCSHTSLVLQCPCCEAQSNRGCWGLYMLLDVHGSATLARGPVQLTPNEKARDPNSQDVVSGCACLPRLQEVGRYTQEGQASFSWFTICLLIILNCWRIAVSRMWWTVCPGQTFRIGVIVFLRRRTSALSQKCISWICLLEKVSNYSIVVVIFTGSRVLPVVFKEFWVERTERW